jgi:hypothetical protein
MADTQENTFPIRARKYIHFTDERYPKGMQHFSGTVEATLYQDGRGHIQLDSMDSLSGYLTSWLGRQSFAISGSQNSQGFWRRVYDFLTQQEKAKSRALIKERPGMKIEIQDHQILITREGEIECIPYNPCRLKRFYKNPE